jgi:hypothetical protein
MEQFFILTALEFETCQKGAGGAQSHYYTKAKELNG